MEAPTRDVIKELAPVIASFCLQLNARLASWFQQPPDHIPGNDLRSLADALFACRNTLLGEQVKLTDQKIKIAFAGAFSSGKSSVLNKLMGSDRLPVSILAETGVACMMERAETNKADVWTKSGQLKESIPDFTKKDLERLMALSEHPEKMKEIQDIDFIHLYIKTQSIPENVVWIDLPGIGDEYGADSISEERARMAAARADVLVWVNASQNPLSIIEDAFFNAYLTGDFPTAILFLYNVWVEGDLSEEEWDKVFNEDFFDNETRIRHFFEPHSKVLYQNQIHKFAAAEIDRLENESYFTRFCKELNKLNTPDRLWIRSYRMKKLAIQCRKLQNKFSALIAEWEEKKATRIQELKAAVEKAVTDIKETINDNFDIAIKSMEDSKQQRISSFSYYKDKDKLTEYLAEDTNFISGLDESLGIGIFEALLTNLFNHKDLEWLVDVLSANPALYPELPDLCASPVKPDRIYAATKYTFDLDAAKDNVWKFGKSILEIFDDSATTPDYESLDKLDYDASARDTSLNLSAGYQSVISSLRNAKTERFSNLKQESLYKFRDLIIADYDTILQQLQSMQTELENLLSLSINYSEVKQL